MAKKLKNKKNQASDSRGGLDARLFAYCAMAAGGALAAAPGADAAIVYSGMKDLALPDNNTLLLDLDSNGTADFTFVNMLGQATAEPGIVNYTTTQGATSTMNFMYGTFVRRKTAKNFVDLAGNPLNGVAAAGAKLRLGQGVAIPGPGISWIGGQAADLSASTITFTRRPTRRPDPDNSTKSIVVTDTFATDKTAGGSFLGRQGYLGVKFNIDNATHYGWIRYQGDTTANAGDNSTELTAAVLDWAYEKLPDTPIVLGQEVSHCAVLSPSRISRVLSFFKPFSTIIIKGDASTTLTKDTSIDWGTDGVKTLFAVPLGKSTLLAVVRIKPALINNGDTYEVTVGECIADLKVGF